MLLWSILITQNFIQTLLNKLKPSVFVELIHKALGLVVSCSGKRGMVSDRKPSIKQLPFQQFHYRCDTDFRSRTDRFQNCYWASRLMLFDTTFPTQNNCLWRVNTFSDNDNQNRQLLTPVTNIQIWYITVIKHWDAIQYILVNLISRLIALQLNFHHNNFNITVNLIFIYHFNVK